MSFNANPNADMSLVHNFCDINVERDINLAEMDELSRLNRFSDDESSGVTDEEYRQLQSRIMIDKLSVKEDKMEAKAIKQAEKEALKVAEKEAKREAKAIKKAEKEALKVAEKEAKKEAKAIKQAEREIIKKIKDAERAGMIKGKQMERERLLKNQLKKQVKHEIHEKALSKMVKVAKQLERDNPDGFTITQCVNEYIKQHGKINPYTLELIEEGSKYDISAAIRGFIYETSPSSSQHWFRYGYKKVREQVAPWIFANKELAMINENYGWVATTPGMASDKRNNIGKWRMIIDGSIAYYDWDMEKYGPLPSEDVLTLAETNRKKGVRKGKPILILKP